MTVLTWDNVGERLYETGVDHGVLYQLDETGAYVDGVPWNGLTTVTESPSGAESNKQYADNTVYVNLISAEEFGGTIEAFTYPDEFGQNDGSDEPAAGVSLGQQGRRPFGLVYRTLQGNDTEARITATSCIWSTARRPRRRRRRTPRSTTPPRRSRSRGSSRPLRSRWPGTSRRPS
jgi:hypothetical protein